MEDIRWCAHCGEQIAYGEVRWAEGDEYGWPYHAECLAA